MRRLRYSKLNNILSSRLLKFCIVGASGTIVNMGVLFLLSEYVRIQYFLSSLVAIELSILSNFYLNLLWTWGDRVGETSTWEKLFRYHMGVAGTAFLCNYLILLALTEWFGMYYLISNIIGIAVGTISNFLINDRWTFRQSVLSEDS